jgi:hypothetical protein
MMFGPEIVALIRRAGGATGSPVRITLRDGGDADLEALMEKWRGDKPFDPRQDTGAPADPAGQRPSLRFFRSHAAVDRNRALFAQADLAYGLTVELKMFPA